MATATTTELVVLPFRIVVDSREQRAYTFENMPPMARDRAKLLAVPTICCGLPTGDYSIEGYENRVAVERKSLQDLYGTLGQGRERFEREFERLNVMDYAAVVIEATWQEIARPREHVGEGWRSQMDPRSVYETIVAWQQPGDGRQNKRFPKVHWFTAGSYRMGEVITFSVLRRFWEDHQ